MNSAEMDQAKSVDQYQRITLFRICIACKSVCISQETFYIARLMFSYSMAITSYLEILNLYPSNFYNLWYLLCMYRGGNLVTGQTCRGKKKQVIMKYNKKFELWLKVASL